MLATYLKPVYHSRNTELAKVHLVAEYYAKIEWHNNDSDFVKGQYTRAHTWQFDGGLTVAASASPHIVPLPYSVEANVDPEEAFVASVASCHMLFFLSIAAKKNWHVEHYRDNAKAVMQKNEQGKLAISHVYLQPEIEFSNNFMPSNDEIEKVHHLAHRECFIANSIKSEVIVRSANNRDLSQSDNNH